MSLAKVCTLCIEQGTSFYKEFQWLIKNTDGKFTPVNITDYHVRCQIRYRASSNIVMQNVPGKIINGTQGTFAIMLNPTQTSNLPTSGKSYKDREIYVFDIELVAAGLKNIYRIVNGFIKVSPEVTKNEL